MNPMTPVNDIIDAIRTDVSTMQSMRNWTTFSPRLLALFSPRDIMLSFLADSCTRTTDAAVMTNISGRSVHEALVTLPTCQM